MLRICMGVTDRRSRSHVGNTDLIIVHRGWQGGGQFRSSLTPIPSRNGGGSILWEKFGYTRGALHSEWPVVRQLDDK